MEDEDTLSEKEEAVLREDLVVGPIPIGMDCLTGDQRKCIVMSVFGDRKNNWLKEEDIRSKKDQSSTMLLIWICWRPLFLCWLPIS